MPKHGLELAQTWITRPLKNTQVKRSSSWQRYTNAFKSKADKKVATQSMIKLKMINKDDTSSQATTRLMN